MRKNFQNKKAYFTQQRAVQKRHSLFFSIFFQILIWFRKQQFIKISIQLPIYAPNTKSLRINLKLYAISKIGKSPCLHAFT